MLFFRSLARGIVICALFALSTLCYQPDALADGSSASLSVAVTDTTGAVVPKATLILRNLATGQEQKSESGNLGTATFPFLKPGRYQLTASKDSFADVVVDNIVLNVGDDRRLQLSLKIGSATQTVNVDGSGLSINTTDASVSTIVDRKFVENMPLNGRSFQDLISMTPGVVTQTPQAINQAVGLQGDFSINGQRAESNYYTVDGVSANVGSGYPNGSGQAGNSGSIAATTALGTTQSLLSVDAMQEFRVLSSTYSAEYGRTPGGQFSLMSRSGTNDVHGSIFDYLRNDALDANDWFNDHNQVRKPALRQNDFGGTIGGPILIPRLYNGKEKSFFFASYEGLRLTQPTAASSLFVPSLSVRSSAAAVLQPIWNAFPVPTGAEIQIACTTAAGNCPTGSPVGTAVPSGLSPFVQAYSLPSQIDSTSVRIDHQATKRLMLFFRFGDTPTYTQSRTLSSIGTRHYDTQTYTAGATSQISHTLTNEFRVGYASSASNNSVVLDDFAGATPIDLRAVFGIGDYPASEPYPYVSISGVGTSAIYDYVAGTRIRQWNITDTADVAVTHHVLKFGVDWRHLVSPLEKPSLYVSPFFTTMQSMLTDVISLSPIKYTSSTPVFREFSAFGQDEWRVSPSVVVSAGARWEVNPPPSEASGNLPYTIFGNVNTPATLSLAPRGTSLWKTSWFNFAPRLGVAWTAHSQKGHETVVRAGGGVFFDTGNQVAAGAFNGLGYFALQTYANASLPVTPAQLNFTTDATSPYTNVFAFPSHLQLPYSLQWSAAVQQSLGSFQAVSITYVASEGRRLLQQQYHSVGALNPNFGIVYFYPNGLTSNYQSLQLQYQRTVSHGLQALASYTWSHALDYGSTNASYSLTRGNSDFDVRDNFQGGLSWDLPGSKQAGLRNAVLSQWSLDARVIARTAFPITLLGNTLTDSLGNRYYSGVNVDSSKPVYLYGSQYPGGRAINGGPLATSPAFTAPTGMNSGNAPRNFIRGFGAGQMNLAMRRAFQVRDSVSIQFRAEAFNITNHPNFGYVDPTLSDATFGQATKMLNQSLGSMSSLYQAGGSRSSQFSLKVVF
jgi:hypothetical protein